MASSSRNDGLSQKARDTSAGVHPRDPEFATAFLGELLASRVIDGLGRERAARAQQSTFQRIDVVLMELGLISPDQLMSAFSSFFRLPIVSDREFPDTPVLGEVIPSEYLVRNKLLPLRLDDDTLVLAIADPFAIDCAKSIGYFADRRIRLCLAPAADINAALDRLYLANLEASGEERQQESTSVNEDDLQRLRDMASEAPIIRLVNRIITAAVSAGASDIHMAGTADGMRVRQRVDGHMTEIERFPSDMQAAIACRVKILAKLNIAERRLPQDGRAKFVVGGREIDLRVSTLPIMHGESIVLRILDQQRTSFDLAKLGFETQQAAQLVDLLRRPNGIVLVTGPTGSGKTTTLYAALSMLNNKERTIFSVEDPIEYQIAGINQTQVRTAIGLDFAQCLRSILRQDPDVIMVGEMRDAETVRVAIQAALTGHLVLSTLHTNSAAASVTRLLDMGAQDFLLASTLNGVIAQRLVRKLCTCARSEPTAPEAVEHLLSASARERLVSEETIRIRRPVGCRVCGNSGYKGRTSILEMLVFDTDLRHLVRSGISDREIESQARRSGMETLYECGIGKVLAGETTLDEVLSSTRS